MPKGASAGFMFASGGAPSEGYGRNGPGACVTYMEATAHPKDGYLHCSDSPPNVWNSQLSAQII